MANNDVNMLEAAPDDVNDPEPLMEPVNDVPAVDNGDGVNPDRYLTLSVRCLPLECFAGHRHS